tara:strand:+ start:2771 stop:3169 length:399 start_codon:yes stop_codon:yes gene_type:complete
MKVIIKNSDQIGAASSALCMLHCFATPFLFLSQSSLIFISVDFTLPWFIINYIFLFISFIAIYYSVNNSSNRFIRIFLYFFWAVLSGLIINESLGILSIPEAGTYLSASSLICLHIYNLKYCRCDDENCCTS